jgi:hypothetical protein
MDRLWVRQKLKSYASVLERITGAGASGTSYFLLELDLEKSEAKFQAYSTADLDAANRDYLAAEKRLRDSPAQVVLVAAESVEAMRQAYPNYFMDTEHFVALLGEIEAAVG